MWIISIQTTYQLFQYNNNMHVTYPLDIDTTSSSFDTFDIHPLGLFVVTPPPPPPPEELYPLL